MRALLCIGLCAVVWCSSTLGAARSTTFKALVDRIEASHVIVYVALNPLMKSSLSGMLTWMTRAGDFRYVRASISMDLTPDQMIATAAHELQHAVEVIEGDSVNDEKSLDPLVTSESVPVMLCQASGPPYSRPRLACPTKPHVRGLLRISSTALQPDP